MTWIFYFAAGLTAFFFSGLIILLLSARKSRRMSRRVLEIARSSSRNRLAGSARDRLLNLAAERVHRLRTRFGLSESATLGERIARAGYRGTLAQDLYIAGRFLGPVVAFLLGSLIESNRAFWMLSLPAITYLLPDMILQQQIRRRRNTIRTGLPDAIDLLVICVDAGLGIDQALLRVSNELGGSHPEIAEELLQINREQQAGKPRIEAWQDMEKRVELPDLTAFVNMLTQTERFGTPISRSLSNFADGLRLKRRQKAEELAAKTTVKIIFPLVLFIFPSMFIVLLGPALLTITRGLTGLGQ